VLTASALEVEIDVIDAAAHPSFASAAIEGGSKCLLIGEVIGHL
jgi:hypothetical protein